MTTNDSYAHGVPSWVDLMTPDPDASKPFYSALFGWTYEDIPTDDNGNTYTQASKNDHVAAGMMQLSEQMAASGMPPVWSMYVSVTDLDATVAKVEPAGGSVLQPPMDVMDIGRMSIVKDPAGAVLGMWEAKTFAGAEVVNEHGALTWNELTTPDPSAVAPFYADVFGWTASTVPMPGGEYTIFNVDGGNDQGVAGAMAAPMPNMPTYWGMYFNVDDCDAAVAKAQELGAKVMMEPTTMEGVGRMAAVADPQGAVFSVMTPES